MNINEFIDKIRELNNKSYSYGNEIFYLMGRSSDILTDRIKLEGAMWIIGRSYAASPQRRSYGTTENSFTQTNDKYHDRDGREGANRPIWPVKTQNDGREGFFDEVARSLSLSCLNGILPHRVTKYKFKPVIIRKKKNNKIESVKIDENDLNLLIKSITAVLSFNKSLSKAIEEFDDVPVGNIFDGKAVNCNNHISFSSKFLHFIFPDIVFIIDSYAFDGGCALFNGKEDEKNRRFIVTPPNENDFFDNSVYEQFDKNVVKEIINQINDKIKDGSAGEGESNISSTDDDGLDGEKYIAHCVRSYLMGVFLKNQGISPINHIKNDQTFQPMPRLVDLVYLNIKKPISKKEEKYQEMLSLLYYTPGHNNGT